jgi:hypothetical protein
MNSSEELVPTKTPENNNADPIKDEIIESTENGYRVFKKKQNGPDEVAFFNSEYFERLGYPGTEVSVVQIDADEVDKMKGGYYDRPDELTFPFRQFVFLLQRTQQTESNPEMIPESELSIVKEQEDTRPGFFERLSSYSVKASEGIRSGLDTMQKYFAKSSTEVSDKTNTREPSKANDAEVESKPEEPSKANDAEVESKPEENSNVADKKEHYGSSYWIVRIPITKSTSLVPFGKYEKEEAKLAQMFKERKIDGDKKVNKVFKEVSEEKSVGVLLCGMLDEKEKSEKKKLLKGTYLEKMDKMNRG